MPRLVYLICFLLLTLAPFPLIWIGQALFANSSSTSGTPNSGINTPNAQSISHARGYGGGFFPFWGGMFFYNSPGSYGGRGSSWVGRSYNSYSRGGSGSPMFSEGGPSSFGK